MTRKGAIVGVGVVIALAGVLGYTVWRMGATQTCEMCQRPLHSLTKTVAMVGDDQETFCCPTCALTAHRQTGAAVTVTQLSDYETNSRLSPKDAFLVHGSDLNLCVQNQALMGPDKHPTPMDFDRCSPSVFAFASRYAAERFRREHGGTLMLFREFETGYLK